MPPAQPQSRPPESTVTGVLERIIFFNDENHFCIAEVRPEDAKNLVTVTGQMPGVQCGETIRMFGQWTHHLAHGPQFKVTKFESRLPSSVHGIRKYLGSGLIPGIGKVYANKIVDAFGAETLRVISEESRRLTEVDGIGKVRAKAIKQAWDEQQSLRDVLVFLQTYGVGTAQCLRLVRAYGNEAKKILQNEPYRVAREIHGIGFKTADQIARNLGIPTEGDARIDAGTLHALAELEDEGHTCYPKPDLRRHAAQMLEVDERLVANRIDAMLTRGDIVQLAGSDLIQLPAQEYAERTTADAIRLLLSAPSKLPAILVDKAVEWAQQRAGFQFAPEQSQALASALSAKVSVITGGPGTGKTTILKALVEILKAKKADVMLAAPTGRAAQRMTETTGVQAKTIHRMLKFDPQQGKFSANASNPLQTDFLVVDEASMLDSKLAAALFRAVPPKAHVLLVGDIHQLPSVGAGNVLKNIIESDQVPVARLNQIFRQAGRSEIVVAAHAMLEGRAHAPGVVDDLSQVDPETDLHFIRAATPEACVDTLLRLCRDFLPRWYRFDPVMDVQVLAPLHKGLAGIGNLNEQLQQALNPGARGVQMGHNRFQERDKVIQTRNNYDKGIFNGDLGRVAIVNPDAGTLAVNFDGQVLDFERLEMADLALAYAISIHKSQGSEFPIVVIPLLKQHFVMLQRNLLYTGVTRGRKKVFIVGDPMAWSMAVRNQESAVRVTGLERRLRA